MDASGLLATQFLAFLHEQGTRGRLAALLADHGRLVSVGMHRDASSSGLPDPDAPRLVFIDFDLDPGTDAGREQLTQARRLCQYAAGRFPRIPRVALIRYDAGILTVEALRAGVSDCLDLGNESDARRTLDRLMEAPPAQATGGAARGRSVLLLGARQGMGVTTLATHLAELCHVHLIKALADRHRKNPQESYRTPSPSSARACLLDLGIPVRDGLLYLGAPEGFHFLDAVNNLHRLDDTLLESALPHDAQGLGILSFPPDLDDMRGITHKDGLALFNRLHDFYGFVVVDAGGMDNLPFIVNLCNAADHVWVVTDQSLGGILSLADYLSVLQGQGVDTQRLELVVNRYDSRYGLSAAQIAEKFGLKLLGTAPDSTLSLWNHLNQGTRLAQSAPRDPYAQAVRRLLNHLLQSQSPFNRQEPAGLHALWGGLKAKYLR
ncbi:AAA family ATPase [Castellaniella sp.]|uniref:AAA family ATPase n=1 Tax=Castellaniella sp. TaxID=1955812 RepID=UPI003C733D62